MKKPVPVSNLLRGMFARAALPVPPVPVAPVPAQQPEQEAK